MKIKEFKLTNEEKELDDIFDQATERFTNQLKTVKYKNKLKNKSINEQFDIIMNDLELCRLFCLFCLASINGFVNHPETIKINKP